MKKVTFLLMAILFMTGIIYAQNVGIGTINPPVLKLHVSSVTDSNLLLLENRNPLGLQQLTSMYFRTGSYYTGAIKTIGSSSNEARLGFFTFGTGNINGLNERMSILDNGNVGINTTAPTADFDVNGAVRIRGNGAASGKVLTSDASGNATWNGSVAFSATGTFQTNPTTNVNTLILYNTELFDDGSNYNPSTAKFTAPVAGNYHFDAAIRLQTGIPPDNSELRIFVNNIVQRAADMDFGFVQISSTLKLNAGDVVDIRYFFNDPNTGAGNAAVAAAPLLNNFSGFLVR